MTAPLVGLGTMAVKSAIAYEDAFAGVRKTTDATEAQYASLSKGIQEMSTRLPIAATELAEVMEAAGQLGVEVENLEAFTEATAGIGMATDMAAADAATNFARFRSILGQGTKDIDRLGSTVVALGNNYAATESEIVDMGLRIAAAGNQAGMHEADIMGFSAALRAVGIEAEAGGTAFSKVILDIDTRAAKGEGALKQYAKVAGMSAKEFKQAWEKDASGAMVTFIEGLGRVQKEGGNLASVLEDLGFKEVRVRDTLMRAAGASESVASAVADANDAWAENVALQNEVDERNKTTASRLTMLKNKGEGVLTSFGEAALPTVGKVMDTIGGLADGFLEMDDAARESILFGAAGVAAAGPLLKVVGTATTGIGKIAEGLGKVKGFLGTGGLGGLLGAHPAMLAVLGVGAAIGGVVYALGTASRQAEAFKKSVRDFDFNLDQAAIDGIQESIEGGKEAYTLYADVKLEMQTKADDLYGQLEEYLADDRFTNRENNKFAKALSDWVDTGVETAEAYAKGQVEKLTGYLDTLTIGDKVNTQKLIGEVSGVFNTIATELMGLDFLTDDQINAIMALAVDPGVTDFNAELANIGIVDPDAQQAVIDAVKPNVDALNTRLKELGILDEGTRAIILQTVQGHIAALSTELSAQELDPGTTVALASMLTSYAAKADAELLKTGIPLLADPTVRGELIDAAMAGPNELKALLANEKLFSAEDAALIEGILDPAALHTAIGEFGLLDGLDVGALGEKWRGELGTLTGELDSTSLLTEGQVNSTLEAMRAKADGLIADIQGLESQITAITDAAISEKRSLTDAELARIRDLMDQVAELQTQIQLLGDTTYQYAAASSNLVKAGKGDQEMFGQALGFAKGAYDDEYAKEFLKHAEQIAEANKAYDEKITVYETMLAGDVIEISTVKGDKYARLRRTGSGVRNIYTNIDPTDALSMPLARWDNLFQVSAASGALNLEAAVTFSPKYWGV